MELFETNSCLIILKGRVALYCEKDSGHLHLEKYEKFLKEWSPKCLGIIDGVFGKVKYHNESDWKLILISESEPAGILPDGTEIRKISKICLHSLSTVYVPSPDIRKCPMHHSETTTENAYISPANVVNNPDGVNTNKPLIRMVQTHFKNAAENVLVKGKQTRDRDKYEKQVQYELIRLLESENDHNFYFATNGHDITCTSQEKQSTKFHYGFPIENNHEPIYHQPIWRKAKSIFFWNEYALSDAIHTANVLLRREGLPEFGKPLTADLSDNVQTELDLLIKDAENIIRPVMQGYFDFVQLSKSNSNADDSPSIITEPTDDCNFLYDGEIIAYIISRRSKMRAGTRYRRRGIDNKGHVANFVETEQILGVSTETGKHILSFVQIRGSIPVYWSQISSFKYKPPIQIEKCDGENQQAFRLHFEEIQNRFKKIVILNLIDSGFDRQENILAEAFQRRILMLNDPDLTYVGFDFHEFCRGVNFENVSVLLKELTETIREMKYCWIDDKGMICEQLGLFRVNCVDCLDRTNLVQCVLSNVVIETQLRKLGLLSPENALPASINRKIQVLWANNGDALSRQYSGTIALKGDFTRTGERTMNGMMRDGVSSVNRYYLRFRDISRQAVIDLILGNEEMPELQFVRSGTEDELIIMRAKEENIKKIVKRCRELCIGPKETCFSECLLTWYKDNSRISREINVVLLISNENIHVISNLSILPYENLEFPPTDGAPSHLCIPLEDIESVEIGLEPSVFKAIHSCIRINYIPPHLENQVKMNKRTSIRSMSPPPHETNTGLMELKKSLSPVTMNSIPITTSKHHLTFAQPDVRLFNNLLVQVGRLHESISALKVLTVHLSIAIQTKLNRYLNVIEKPVPIKLDRVRQASIPQCYQKELNVPEIFQELEINPLVLRRINLVEKLSRSLKIIGPNATNKPRAVISMKEPDQDIALFVNNTVDKRISSDISIKSSNWFSTNTTAEKNPNESIKKRFNQFSNDFRSKFPPKMNNFVNIFKKHDTTEKKAQSDVKKVSFLTLNADENEEAVEAMDLIEDQNYAIKPEILKKFDDKVKQSNFNQDCTSQKSKFKKRLSLDLNASGANDKDFKSRYDCFYNQEKNRINKQIGIISKQLSNDDLCHNLCIKESESEAESEIEEEAEESISGEDYSGNDEEEHYNRTLVEKDEKSQIVVEASPEDDDPSTQEFYQNNVILPSLSFEKNHKRYTFLVNKQENSKRVLNLERLSSCPNVKIETKFILF